MISMHCPSCGAQGRIPSDKVNVRLLCKRCLESFHLTADGRVLAGSPPESPAPAPHERPGHELDAVERELDLVVAGLKPAAMVIAVLAASLLMWTAFRGRRAVELDEQVVQIARALVKQDVETLRSLAVEGTDDEAAILSEVLAPEFHDRADGLLQAASPSVDVSRVPEPPGPGLSHVVASIRPDRPVGRMGIEVPDVSASLKPPETVELPIILAGDDHEGWRLDGERTLEAYRRSRASAATGRSTRGGQAPVSIGTGARKPSQGSDSVPDPRA